MFSEFPGWGNMNYRIIYKFISLSIILFQVLSLTSKPVYAGNSSPFCTRVDIYAIAKGSTSPIPITQDNQILTNNLMTDKELDKIVYGIQLLPGEDSVPYRLFVDSYNPATDSNDKDFPGDTIHGPLTGEIVGNHGLYVSNFSDLTPGTHTIYVERNYTNNIKSPCGPYQYQILSQADEPIAKCTKPLTITPDKPSFQDPVTLSVQTVRLRTYTGFIHGGSDQPHYRLLRNQEEVHDFSDSNTVFKVPVDLSFNVGVLPPGQNNFALVIKDGSVDSTSLDIVLCDLSVYVCTPEEIANKSDKCGAPPPPEPEICKSNLCTSINYCKYPCNTCYQCPDYQVVPPKARANLSTLCQSAAGGVPEHPEFLEACLRCTNTGIWSALGCLPTDLNEFVNKYLFTTGIGIIGGVAFLYLLYGAFLIMTSAGNPEQVAQAQEIITSSLMGLLLAIFSLLILRIISVDILQLPEFGPLTPTPIPPLPTPTPHGILP